MAYVGLEPRLPPLGNTLLTYLADTSHALGSKARARSVPGFIPYWLNARYANEDAQEAKEDHSLTEKASVSFLGGIRAEAELYEFARDAWADVLVTESGTGSTHSACSDNALGCRGADALADRHQGKKAWADSLVMESDTDSTHSPCSDEALDIRDSCAEFSGSDKPVARHQGCMHRVCQKGNVISKKQRCAKIKIEGEQTTVMVRNLPSDLGQEAFVREIQRAGFDGLVDFLYLPIDFSTRRNKCYAFLNFRSSEMSQWFMKAWQGAWPFHYQQSALSIRLAEVQGLDANITLWNTPAVRRIRNPNYRPMIVDGETLSATEVTHKMYNTNSGGGWSDGHTKNGRRGRART